MKARVSARVLSAALCAVAVFFALAGQACAQRALITDKAVNTKDVPGGAILDACGIAFRGAQIYVSDYYNDKIEIFNALGEYQSQLSFPSASGPCQLATSPTDALYVNDWHEGASQLLPSSLSLDQAESTGLAVDAASGNLYVNDRTYVAVYEPSGAPLLKEGVPLRIGLGTLGEGYGLTLFAGRLYVPDAADSTVKVYEPALDTVNPVSVIDGSATPQRGFNSLVDAAVVVDPANAHLLVLDNLQPGFEHPEAVLDEFSPSGEFLGQVAKKLIDAEPSGLAFAAANLYATSGNGAEGTVFKFGPYVEGATASAPQAQAPDPPQAPATQSAVSTATAEALAPAPPSAKAHHRRHRAKHRAKARQKQAKAQR